MNILEKYERPFEYIGAFMNLMLAYQFFNLWYKPTVNDVFKINDFAILMAFEFVMVHSGVFMSVFPKKISLFVFVPLYGLFAWAMNASVSDNSILIIYGVVVFNRMRFAFSDVSKAIRNRNILFSVLAVAIYFFLVLGFTILNEKVPRLGLTENFLTKINYFDTINASGLFVEKPHVPLALGTVYYIFLCLLEIKLKGNSNNYNDSYKHVQSN